jgi:hypothetical protein
MMRDHERVSFLDEVVERAVLVENDGKSGARLERAVLRDGRRVVVKRMTPASDFTMSLVGDTEAREYQLWSAGVLDRLPEQIGHCVLDAFVEDGETVIVMSDLGDAVLTWDDRLDPAQVRACFGAVAALHRTFLGTPPPEAPAVHAELGVFGPSRLAPQADDNALFTLVLRGWEHFRSLVPADLADAVIGLAEDPGPLARRFADGPVTLVHGDLATVNMAPLDGRLYLLDWALAAAAPGALDVARFLAGCAHVVDVQPDALVESYRAEAGDAYDDRSMRLALLSGVVWLGWNKALDIVEHDDPAVRAREKSGLRWWLARAEEALERDL